MARIVGGFCVPHDPLMDSTMVIAISKIRWTGLGFAELAHA
jgi:hypothetical protein